MDAAAYGALGIVAGAALTTLGSWLTTTANRKTVEQQLRADAVQRDMDRDAAKQAAEREAAKESERERAADKSAIRTERFRLLAVAQTFLMQVGSLRTQAAGQGYSREDVKVLERLGAEIAETAAQVYGRADIVVRGFTWELASAVTNVATLRHSPDRIDPEAIETLRVAVESYRSEIEADLTF
jgi:hypothetical protein